MFPTKKMISKDFKANDSSGFRGYLSLQRHVGNHYSPVTIHCHYSSVTVHDYSLRIFAYLRGVVPYVWNKF